jgi:hypothetical protein
MGENKGTPARSPHEVNRPPCYAEAFHRGLRQPSMDGGVVTNAAMDPLRQLAEFVQAKHSNDTANLLGSAFEAVSTSRASSLPAH